MNNQFDQNNKITDAEIASNLIDRNQEDDDANIKEILSVFIKYRVIILVVSLLSLLAGGLVALFSTPIYSVDALLQIEEKKSMGMGFGDMPGMLSGVSGSIAEMEILKSRTIRLGAINKLGLDINASPKYFPGIGRKIFTSYSGEGILSEPWFGFSSYAWGGEKILVEQLKVPEVLWGEELSLIVGKNGTYQLFNDGGKKLLEGLVGQVSNNGKGLVVFVSQLVARPKTEFILIRYSPIEALDEIGERLAVSEIGKQSGILSVSFRGDNKQKITKTLNTIVSEFVTQNVERGSKEAQNSLVFLEKQLPNLKTKVDEAAKIHQEYRVKNGSVNLFMETKGVLENILVLENSLLSLKQERDVYRQKFKPDHPVIIGISNQVASQELALEKLNISISQLPETQRQVLKLEQDLQINTLLYQKLLNRVQELNISKASSIGNVRIIDYGMLPEEPVKPKKILILVISLVLGVFLGSGIAFVLHAFTSGVESPIEIEDKFNIPVYASILKSKTLEKFNRQGNKELLLTTIPDDPAIESLRSLRTTLYFTLMSAKNNIIMVTGVSPGVGKTFISSNLSGILTENNKTVVLVDVDLRRGTINNLFNISRDKGLSECLAGIENVENVIQRTSVEGLSIITSGQFPDNPAKLLMGDSFMETLMKLSDMFDYVILDTPPILAVSDAAIIGRSVGVTLFVLKSNAHPMRELEQGVKRLSNSGINIDGFILNGAEIQKGKVNGYGDYMYHYDYKSK